MGLAEPLRLILYLLIGAGVVWFIFWVIGYMGLPETPRRIIVLIVAIIVLIFLLRLLVPGIL